MFKKKLAIIAAAALMTLSASSAFAAFADLQLIRVVYERTTGTVETATDLGSISSLLAPGSTTTIAGPALTATNAANLFVVYFAIDHTATATQNLWISSDTTTVPVAVGTLGFNTTKSATTSVFTNYANLSVLAGGSSTVNGSQADPNSYRLKLAPTQGAMANGINGATRPFVEASLAALVNGTAGSVAQSLYVLNGNSATTAAVKVADIFTNANGSTTINAVATPIPAAFYLMGSGLMGLVGLRRRNKVA